MEPEYGSFNGTELVKDLKLSYRGKVKNIYELDEKTILFEYSDRLSCYDKYRCEIKGKGIMLNELNAYWMRSTEHIIPNHYLYHENRFLLTKKAKRIDIEVIVRAYYAGSIAKAGGAEKYGITLPEGLNPGDKLPELIITPTTKGDVDIPLKEEEIFEKKIIKRSDWEYIKCVAKQLFTFGAMLSNNVGLDLIDTKYEFGYDEHGKIILIDELHTGDSSRFWLMETKENLDKDHVRRFVSDNPEEKNIPKEVMQQVFDAYYSLHKLFITSELQLDKPMTKYYFLNYYTMNFCPLVIVIAGSESDFLHVEKINNELKKLNICYHNYFHSAHKETTIILEILEYYEHRKNIVYVTVAGRSNALGGVVASNTKHPVINCPPFKDQTDMLLNINSSLMMPKKVPSAVILEPENVALFIAKIL
jgi:fusion protein PurCD